MNTLAFIAALLLQPIQYTPEPGLYPWRGYLVVCVNEQCEGLQSRDLYDTQAERRAALAPNARNLFEYLRRERPAARVTVQGDCAEDRSAFNA